MHVINDNRGFIHKCLNEISLLSEIIRKDNAS